MTALVQCGDVRDLPKAVRKCLNDGLRKRGASLNPEQYEEAFAYLCLKAWEEWLRFDPWHEATYERSFSTFLYRRLTSWRLDEWFRSEYGDSRYGKNRVSVELREDERELISDSIQWPEVVASMNTAFLSSLGKLTHEKIAIPHYMGNTALEDLEKETGIPKPIIARRLKQYRAEVEHWATSQNLLVAA